MAETAKPTFARVALTLLAGCALAIGSPVAAQDDAISSDQRAYAAAMQRLARYPDDADAMRNAALAAVRLGDLQTAGKLASRASGGPAASWPEAVQASLMAQRAEARGAVQLFLRAEAAGTDLTDFAAERGLAYDLAGDQPSAQYHYARAMRMGYGGEGLGAEATRRYALSLAISGQFAEGERLLAPLIARQDRSAWRVRAFMLAIAGRTQEAVTVIETILPPALAAQISPYMRQMPSLSRGQQAGAALLGLFPAQVSPDDGNTAASVPAARAGADLTPAGRPFGTDEKRRRPGDD